jgi:hypothetical protein
MALQGSKVRIRRHLDWGFGEVKSSLDGHAEIAFARGLSEWHVETFPSDEVIHDVLPTETRCFVSTPTAARYGRVLSMRKGGDSLRTYYVRWGGAEGPVELTGR